MNAEIKHTVVIGTGTVIAAGLSLAYTVYVGRVLGPSSSADFFGALFLALLFIAALGPINGTVAKFAAQYAVAERPGKTRTLWREVSKRVAMWGGLALVAVWLLMIPTAHLLNMGRRGLLPVAGAVVFCTALVSVGRGVMRGAHHFKSYNANVVLEAFLRLGVGVALVHRFGGALAALSAYVAALVVALAVSSWQARRVWRGHAVERLDGSPIRQFSARMFLMMFVSAGFLYADMLFVKTTFGDADAGVYGAAANLSRAIGVLATPFNIVLLPILAARQARGKPPGSTLLRMCLCFAGAACTALAIIWFGAREALTTLYGAGYAVGAPLLFPICIVRIMGHLAFMLALGCLSIDRYGFLRVYAVGLAVELIGLCVWHASFREVIWVTGLSQTVTAAALAVFLVATRRPDARPQETDVQAESLLKEDVL